MSYNIIFMGTPDFAVPYLTKLKQNSEFKIQTVVTQEDKKIGRKQILTPTPVKAQALKFNLPIYQPKKISEIEKEIENLKPDLIVVVAYGQIIPKSILNIPKFGCINVHGSLLPKYRGSSCLQAPILNNDKKTGATIMKINEGLDTGDILTQTEIILSKQDNLESVHDKVSEAGSEILIDSLLGYIKGEIKPQTQNEKQASYVKNVKKEDGKINLNDSPYLIERKVRAYNPWPGFFGKIEDKTIKIIEAGNLKENKKNELGELFSKNDKLFLQLKDNLALELKKVQLEGKGIVAGEDFIKGYQKFLKKIMVSSSSG